jgi:AraC family transcriptional regulator
MSSLPQSDFQAAHSSALRAGESESLPAGLVTRDNRQTLERIAEGRESGVSAAIWTRQEHGLAETRHDGFADLHTLTVRLKDQKIERWLDGRPVRDEESRPGASYLLPAGLPSRFLCYGSYRTFTFFLPTSLFERNARDMGIESGILERLAPGISYDPAIDQLAARTILELEAGAAGSRLQLDAIGSILCVHLLRRAAGAQACRPFAKGGLAGWQLRRIEDCIATRLKENLSLTSLADEIGLSPYHFARAFKISTGQSPHRYLLRCRLERAKQLLATSEASIGEIAASIGYDDPTQLSRLFRAALDTTPHAYRKDARL